MSFSYSRTNAFAPPSLPKTYRSKQLSRNELRKECDNHLTDFYAGPLERSYLEEEGANVVEDEGMELNFMEEEWEECSLADSEVSFEMVDEELPEGTPKSFRDVLLSGLIEGQFVNDLPRTVPAWGSAPTAPVVVSQPSSYNNNSVADVELIWEDSKNRGAKSKKRDAVRKTKEKDRKDQEAQQQHGSKRR
ncbi:hypothetical protein TrST_g13976 [Triparma strigata]|uniref:Uncharacterized protein n=1 Tax=Triparma strigata TaxID=1606541 RepID=A0A9W7ESL5_9STRA|nr:hypothetical protein TrST_g13976 [Triparma strigata]